MLLGLMITQPSEPTPVRIEPSRVVIRDWQGFGCSLSWWAVGTETWPEAARQEVCRRLFGKGSGCLGLSIVRYNAGGTAPNADPALFRPGGKVQVTLDADGTFHPERDRGQLACLQAAARLGARTFELFVNSPPYWMLRNGDTRGADDGGENLKPECEAEYARWLVRVAAHVERHAAVRLESVAPFNEPSASWWRRDKSTQEGCRILPASQGRILRNLDTELKNRPRPLVIAASDENDPATAIRTLGILMNPNQGGVQPNVIGRVNVHSYFGWQSQEKLRQRVDELGIRRVWMSEVSFREWENAGYIPQDMRCALPQTRAIVNDLKRLRPNGWVYWQAVEPLELCLRYRFTYGLIQAALRDPVEWNAIRYEPGRFVVSKAFWALMVFSRFLRPGCRFIETSDFWTLAAISPDSRRLIIVVHHDEPKPRPWAADLSAFRLVRPTAEIWRTMDDRDGIEWNCRADTPRPIRRQCLEDVLPPRSVTAYVIPISGQAKR